MAWQSGPGAILPTAGHWTTRSRVAIFWTRKPIKRTIIFAKLSCNTQHRMRHYNTSFKLHFRPAKSRIFCMLIKCTTHWLPVPSPPYKSHIFWKLYCNLDSKLHFKTSSIIHYQQRCLSNISRMPSNVLVYWQLIRLCDHWSTAKRFDWENIQNVTFPSSLHEWP